MLQMADLFRPTIVGIIALHGWCSAEYSPKKVRTRNNTLPPNTILDLDVFRLLSGGFVSLLINPFGFFMNTSVPSKFTVNVYFISPNRNFDEPALKATTRQQRRRRPCTQELMAVGEPPIRPFAPHDRDGSGPKNPLRVADSIIRFSLTRL